MSCLITKEAPEFAATAVMPDNSFRELNLSTYRGKYVILFFYPFDFTFVCPTEILGFNKKLKEFKELNTEIIGVSTDSHHTHLAWKNTSTKEGGIGNIQYPLVADLDKNISRAYEVLVNDEMALRGLFLIDKEGIIRHYSVSDDPLGRNIDETLRIVKALQFSEKHGVVCPANWNDGDDTMKPNAESVAKYLAEHV